MIVYNVTVKVEPASAQEWIDWMKGEHIPELMATGLFVDCRLCHLLEQDETDGITYSAQYVCKDREAYQNYIDNHASAMREKGLKRFAGKFVAFRSLMKII